VLEKNVVLYGGEGSTVSFSSSPTSDFCSACNANTRSDNSPTAVVEAVEPVVLGTKIVDCNCPCGTNECIEIPESVCCCLDGDVSTRTDTARLYVSYGIFSVIRIQRPAQLLVHATDYSVPDKECNGMADNDNPCALFRTIAFPTNQFRGTNCAPETNIQPRNNPGCGCRG
jgi:hypothetical protein